MIGYMRCNMPKPGSSRFLTFAKNTLLSNCIGKYIFFMQIDILTAFFSVQWPRNMNDIFDESQRHPFVEYYNNSESHFV